MQLAKTLSASQFRMIISPMQTTTTTCIAILLSTLFQSTHSFSPSSSSCLDLGGGVRHSAIPSTTNGGSIPLRNSSIASTCKSTVCGGSTSTGIYNQSIGIRKNRSTTFRTFSSTTTTTSPFSLRTRLFGSISSSEMDHSISSQGQDTNNNNDSNTDTINDKKMTNVNFSFTTDPVLSSSDDENETSNVIFMAKSSILETLLSSSSFFNNDNPSSSSFTETNKQYLSHMISQLTNSKSNHSGDSITSLIPTSSNEFISCSMISLPSKVTRHNHPLSLHKMTDLVSKHCPKHGSVKLYVLGVTEKDVAPIAAAIARGFPIYSSKSTKSSKSDTNLKLEVCYLDDKCQPLQLSSDSSILASAGYVADNVRHAAKLVDMPPCELSTSYYTKECQTIAEELGDCVSIEITKGESLKELWTSCE